MLSMKQAGSNINVLSRILLGSVFIGVGLFSLFNSSTSFSNIVDNIIEFNNVVGITLVVFGIFVIIRAFARS